MICECCGTDLHGFIDPNQEMMCNVCIGIKWGVWGEEE